MTSVDPDWLKLAGFVILVVGLIGEIAVLFIPHGRRKLEKTLSVIFIVVVISGVVVERIGDSEISKRNSPRDLFVEQQKRISERLKRFSGLPFEIITYPFDPETVLLADKVRATLVMAGWEFRPIESQLLGVVSGIYVAVDKNAEEDTREAARALVSSLNIDGGLACEPELDKEMRSGVKMQINVAKRP